VSFTGGGGRAKVFLTEKWLEKELCKEAAGLHGLGNFKHSCAPTEVTHRARETEGHEDEKVI
jgi:hypothetical protein